MRQLAAVGTRVAADPGGEVADRELKFALPAGRVQFSRRWLAQACRPDTAFPCAVVSTIYYDTPGYDSLREKINSEHLKAKVRVRWYSDLQGRPDGPAFIEAKRREGARRVKRRVALDLPARVVAAWDLHDARLEALPALLRREGVMLPDGWRPLLKLRYRRDRFSDVASGARVSLDAEITAVAANRRFVSMLDARPLDFGVLEIKGRTQTLPPALRPLVRLGARRQAVSKYLAVYRRMTHTMS